MQQVTRTIAEEKHRRTISLRALVAWCDKFLIWVEYVAAVRLSSVVVSGKPEKSGANLVVDLDYNTDSFVRQRQLFPHLMKSRAIACSAIFVKVDLHVQFKYLCSSGKYKSCNTARNKLKVKPVKEVRVK